MFFLDIGSFFGYEMSSPQNDPGVDLDDDQEMAGAEDQAGDRPGPHDHAQVPASVRRRPNTRFRMELGGQLC